MALVCLDDVLPVVVPLADNTDSVVVDAAVKGIPAVKSDEDGGNEEEATDSEKVLLSVGCRYKHHIVQYERIVGRCTRYVHHQDMKCKFKVLGAEERDAILLSVPRCRGEALDHLVIDGVRRGDRMHRVSRRARTHDAYHLHLRAHIRLSTVQSEKGHLKLRTNKRHLRPPRRRR